MKLLQHWNVNEPPPKDRRILLLGNITAQAGPGMTEVIPVLACVYYHAPSGLWLGDEGLAVCGFAEDTLRCLAWAEEFDLPDWVEPTIIQQGTAKPDNILVPDPEPIVCGADDLASCGGCGEDFPEDQTVVDSEGETLCPDCQEACKEPLSEEGEAL